MPKNPIYAADPESIRYMGHRYVLAAEEGDTTGKKQRPSSARVRIDKCQYGGIKFVVEALVLDSKKNIPFGGKATSNTPELTLYVYPIRTKDKIPQSIMEMLPEGDPVHGRIDKYFAGGSKDTTQNDKGLYVISAEGGWIWSDVKKGTKGTEDIQTILRYVAKDRPALLYAYCANHLVPVPK